MEAPCFHFAILLTKTFMSKRHAAVRGGKKTKKNNLEILKILVIFFCHLRRVLILLTVVFRIGVEALCIAAVSDWRYDRAATTAVQKIIPGDTLKE